MNVCVIPARGGSKRIPRKNIRPFHGRPIIHYAIAVAEASGLFDEVIVSTDDEEIATVAHLGGCAQVIKRPAELADAYAGTQAVMQHALRWLLDEGAPVAHACCLYAPTPLVTIEDLEKGYRRLIDSGKCYAFAVAAYSPGVQHALRMDEHGVVQAVWPNFNQVRSQDLEPRWYGAGQWYWGKADAFVNGIELYGPWSVGVQIPRARAIDIDTEDDWRLAEALYEMGQRA